MQQTDINRRSPFEAAILARVLGRGKRSLPMTMARYILDCEFSQSDKARMHQLAVRNQSDTITPGERRELRAFANAGTLLSTLKSKARRALRKRPSTRASRES